MIIEAEAHKLAIQHVKTNCDINKRIAEFAANNNLNLNQLKRLVEETNKAVYTEKLSKTGEQIFDVADLEKVKNFYKPNLEKNAEYNSLMENTMTLPAYGFDSLKEVDLSKTAENKNEFNLDEYSEKLAAFNNAVQTCEDKCGEAARQMHEIQKTAKYLKPALEKVAEENLGKELSAVGLSKLAEDYLNASATYLKYNKMKDSIIEKRAGLISTGVGKVIGVAARNPLKTMNVAFTANQAMNSAKKANEIATPHEFVGNMNPELLEKKAGLNDIKNTAISAAERILGSDAFLGGLATFGVLGLATAAGRGFGSVAEKMLEKRKFNQTFNDIVTRHPELADARPYYDVITRHAPSLAKDPLVAAQLVKQFDAFGGVDVNTVGKMREIETRGGNMQGGKDFDLAAKVNSYASFLPKNNQQQTTNP